jgi:hypothetical protein
MKPPKKSAEKTAPGVPFEKGADPRRGRGPKPGTGGRPPNEFRDRMRELANLQEVEAYTLKCLNGEFGPRFHLEARKWVAERGYGKPTQALEVFNVDMKSLSNEQLQRIAEGEHPLAVLATVEDQGAGGD